MKRLVVKGGMTAGAAIGSFGRVTKRVGGELKELGGRKWLRGSR
jgi:hypothetical protein